MGPKTGSGPKHVTLASSKYFGSCSCSTDLYMEVDESVHLREDRARCCLEVGMGYPQVEDKGCYHLVEDKVEDRTAVEMSKWTFRRRE